MDRELEIVNAMLRVTGARRTPTLGTGHPDVINALNALREYSIDFQGRGWWFNKDYRVVLLPDTSGEIVIPDNWLSFSVAYPEIHNGTISEKSQYVQRDGKMYDTLNHTYNIGKQLLVDTITDIGVNNLPSTAASYLKHKAAKEYYIDDDGDIEKSTKLKDRVTEAWNTLMAEELRNTATNALQTPAAQAVRYRIHQFSSPSNPYFPGGRRL